MTAQQHNNGYGTKDDTSIRAEAAHASQLLASRAAEKKAVHALPEDPMPDQADGYDTEGQDYPRGIVQFCRRYAVYIVLVAVVAVVVAFALIAFRAFLPDMEGDNVIEAELSYVSPYDWTKLDRTNGRYAYLSDGQVVSRLGVDVSENQHEIDWQQVAADGIDFAMIRLGYRGATEGALYLDGYYQSNISAARSAGIDCGIYFFSQAITVEEAIEEADFVISNLGGIALEYPVAFDLEEAVTGVEHPRTAGLGTETLSAVAAAFCNRIEQAGYSAIVYGNAADLSRYALSELESRDIWWAEYGVPTPSAKIDISMWQYTNGATVAGIPTAVDMDIDLSPVLQGL